MVHRFVISCTPIQLRVDLLSAFAHLSYDDYELLRGHNGDWSKVMLSVQVSVPWSVLLEAANAGARHPDLPELGLSSAGRCTAQTMCLTCVPTGCSRLTSTISITATAIRYPPLPPLALHKALRHPQSLIQEADFLANPVRMATRLLTFLQETCAAFEREHEPLPPPEPPDPDQGSLLTGARFGAH